MLLLLALERSGACTTVQLLVLSRVSVLPRTCVHVVPPGTRPSILAPDCLSGLSELRLCACLASYIISGGYACDVRMIRCCWHCNSGVGCHPAVMPA